MPAADAAHALYGARMRLGCSLVPADDVQRDVQAEESGKYSEDEAAPHARQTCSG